MATLQAKQLYGHGDKYKVMTQANKQIVRCPTCQGHTRIIKVGIMQTKKPKQKYFCYGCRSQFSLPIILPTPWTKNSSGIEEPENDI